MSMEIYTPNDIDIIHKTKVDFRKRPVQNEIHLVQYDKTLPVVEVELLYNGNTYICPVESEVFVRWCNKDLTFVYKKCKVSTDRTKVYFEVDEYMSKYSGKVSPIMELNIGEKASGSSPLLILIDRNPMRR